jgi:Resolvase, N terminal domain
MRRQSGKRADRPQLAAALATCRATRAILLVAKLDRLSRNLAFLANLMDAEVDFICCDTPHATRFTLRIPIDGARVVVRQECGALPRHTGQVSRAWLTLHAFAGTLQQRLEQGVSRAQLHGFLERCNGGLQIALSIS